MLGVRRRRRHRAWTALLEKRCGGSSCPGRQHFACSAVGHAPAVAPVRYPQYPSGVVSASTEGYATAPRAVPRKPARTIVSICFAKALGTALQERANGSTTRQRAAVGRQRFGLLSKSGLPCGTGRSTTGGAAQELIAPVGQHGTRAWGASRRPPRCAINGEVSASAAKYRKRWATASRRRSSSSPCSGPSCTASSRPALCGNQPVRRVHRVDGVGDDATIQHERAVKF